jgi:hypothetical protein
LCGDISIADAFSNALSFQKKIFLPSYITIENNLYKYQVMQNQPHLLNNIVLLSTSSTHKTRDFKGALLEFSGGMLGGAIMGGTTFVAGAYFIYHGDLSYYNGYDINDKTWTLHWIGYAVAPLGCASGTYIIGNLLNRKGKFGAALGGSYLGAFIQFPLFELINAFGGPMYEKPYALPSLTFLLSSLIPSISGTLCYEWSRPKVADPQGNYNAESRIRFAF